MNQTTPRIAQSGRAPALGAGGRWIEATCADHLRMGSFLCTCLEQHDPDVPSRGRPDPTRKWGCSSVGRAPGLQPGCRRFDSDRFHQFAPVAQLVEHTPCKGVVAGSIPCRGHQSRKRGREADGAGFEPRKRATVRGFESHRFHQSRGSSAEEQQTHNLLVAGSIPAPATQSCGPGRVAQATAFQAAQASSILAARSRTSLTATSAVFAWPSGRAFLFFSWDARVGILGEVGRRLGQFPSALFQVGQRLLGAVQLRSIGLDAVVWRGLEFVSLGHAIGLGAHEVGLNFPFGGVDLLQCRLPPLLRRPGVAGGQDRYGGGEHEEEGCGYSHHGGLAVGF